ncbi:sugar ABC transporter substrate-binding protein [Microbacterium capsulatum]|uniref:Sugar ABC transporter substrate-binding protein n=1 Tax=Microbacterium capsulatum TaxID=3041921 RepID=A0ABU0XEF5_9MICO|nr:sugar ABC transporter substrate-binding protein [Microbacterium sp. ASV81]MDQ4213497.1 sugar ABC transporter substrate-binding protein [Microbacterium sp. ASV81]
MFSSTRAKRIALAAPIAGALVISLAACGGASGTSAGSDKAGDGKKVTDLTIIAANSPWTAGLKTLAADYKKETGVTVNIQAYGNEQLNDTLKVKLNAKSSDFDILGYQVQDVMREFSRNGWLEDMTKDVTSDSSWNWKDFQPAARDAVQLDGKVYGVPVMTERQIVYYRTDLLKAAGLEAPKTLEELEADVAKLNDPANGVYGIAMRGSRVPLVTQLSSFLYSYGADFQDKKGKASLDTPQAIKAIQLYGDLLHKYGPPGSTNMGWVEASAIFAQGKAAFYIDADSQAYTFLDKQKSSVVDTVGFAQFPAGPAGSKFYNIVPQTIGINAFSTKKAAAWDFIKWVSNEKNSKWLLSKATVPVARQSAWDDSTAAASFPAGIVKIIRTVSDHGVGHDRPQLEQVAAARDIVGGPVVTAIEGGDVKADAKSANSKFQDLLNSEK